MTNLNCPATAGLASSGRGGSLMRSRDEPSPPALKTADRSVVLLRIAVRSSAASGVSHRVDGFRPGILHDRCWQSQRLDVEPHVDAEIAEEEPREVLKRLFAVDDAEVA